MLRLMTRVVRELGDGYLFANLLWSLVIEKRQKKTFRQRSRKAIYGFKCPCSALRSIPRDFRTWQLT